MPFQPINDFTKLENTIPAAIPNKNKIKIAGMVAIAHFTINLTIAKNGISILEICTLGAGFLFNLFVKIFSTLISPLLNLSC